MLADIALWRLDTLAHDATAHARSSREQGSGEQGSGEQGSGEQGSGEYGGGDPVAALVLGPPAPLALLLVNGRRIVEDGELRTADAAAVTRGVRDATRRLLEGSRR
jgi:hypothetical protein